MYFHCILLIVYSYIHVRLIKRQTKTNYQTVHTFWNTDTVYKQKQKQNKTLVDFDIHV